MTCLAKFKKMRRFYKALDRIRESAYHCGVSYVHGGASQTEYQRVLDKSVKHSRWLRKILEKEWGK